MSADFRVTIDGPRGDEWERIAGTRTFPVLTPIPRLADLPGYPMAEVFLLDIAELEPAVLVKIVEHLAAKFQMTVTAASETLTAAPDDGAQGSSGKTE